MQQVNWEGQFIYMNRLLEEWMDCPVFFLEWTYCSVSEKKQWLWWVLHVHGCTIYAKIFTLSPPLTAI